MQRPNIYTEPMASAARLNALWMSPPSQPYAKPKRLHETKALASDLRRHIYTGVRKQRMGCENIYALSSNGVVLSSPATKGYRHKPPKCTDWTPSFMKAECFHYLFDAAIKLHQFGLDMAIANRGPAHNVRGIWGLGRTKNNRFVHLVALTGNQALETSRRCILLDIEGTTTPISFVTDVLFPYARDNVRKHLTVTYDAEETKDDIKLLRAQVEEDLEQGVLGAQPIPPDDAGKEEVITSLVANVEAMIKADRKITPLKQLQGHIWRTGFQSNELEGAVFKDVPEALQKWNASGIKVYIYSSGSRESQRLIFGKTKYGDLRKYLCGFFDTTIGNKREASSYFEISQSVGVDSPSDILFLTDVYQEAVAAKTAGLEVVISIRPGNGTLPENHGFRTIESFLEV